METLKKSLKAFNLSILCTLLMITSISSNSHALVGEYDGNSAASKAVYDASLENENIVISFLKAALTLVAAAYGAGYVVGRLSHVGFDAVFGAHPDPAAVNLGILELEFYNPYDFSKFDS